MSNRYAPEEIVPALSHRNGRVRRYAAMMLGIGGDDQLVAFLVDLLQADSPSARRSAARALGTSLRPFSDPGRAAGSGPDAVDQLAVESLTAAAPGPGFPGAGPRRRRVADILGSGVPAGAAAHAPGP